MYNTYFDAKKAKFLIILKRNYWDWKKDQNGVSIGCGKSKYMENLYGIYAYSIEDILIFLEKELIAYFAKNNLSKEKIWNRGFELSLLYDKFLFYDLDQKVCIEKGCHNKKYFFRHFPSLKNYYLFNDFDCFTPSILYYKSRAGELIERIAIDKKLSDNLKYSYPVIKINKEYSYHERSQSRKTFHSVSNNYSFIPKYEIIAGSDPEYSCFLSARQKHRGHASNWGKAYHKNRNNVPGDWKHYNKCRKQWAKRIKNPSYEKLSKAVWNQEMKDLEKLEELLW